MKYDMKLLQTYIDNGLVDVQSHPTLPLKIYNYSRECAFGKKWDEITLSMRGTILDNDGNLIARGFPKFFNYEEHSYNEIPWNDEYVYIQDKADGSLGIIFWYGNDWVVATRGSFTSDQAIKAKEILMKQCNVDRFIKEAIYLVEILYQQNRVVVNYEGAEKLIFLSAHLRKDDSYSELNWNTALAIFHASEIKFEDIVETDMADMVKLDSFITQLKSKNITNREGYVLRFYPSNFRMKIKFEDYVRLHSLMTKFSNVDIWKCLSTGTPIDLENVPDEFDEWVKKNMYTLLEKFTHVNENSIQRYNSYVKDNGKTEKKEFAQWVLTQTAQYRPILFSLYNGKNYDPIIWKLLRPVYQRPFWQSNTEVE